MLSSLKKVLLPSVAVLMVGAGCAVGPDYQRPPVEVPKNWKEATPRDGESRIRWWEIFDNPELDALEAQALVANETLKRAIARVEEARQIARISAADFYPTITFDPRATRQGFPVNRLTTIPQTGSLLPFTSNLFTVPLLLNQFRSEYTTQWTLMMAGSVIAVLPVLIIYILGQRHIISGIAMTGLKA